MLDELVLLQAESSSKFATEVMIRSVWIIHLHTSSED